MNKIWKHVLETEDVKCTDNNQVNLHVRLLHTTATLSYYKTCPGNRTWHNTCSVSRTCLIVR
jgi:hypothetical protein